MTKYYSPFTTLALINKILAFVGFYMHDGPKSRARWMLYQIFRVYVFVQMSIYLIDTAIYVVQVYMKIEEDLYRFIEATLSVLAALTALLKFLNILLQTKRIDELNFCLKSDEFKATDDEENEYFLKNARVMSRLSKAIIAELIIFTGQWYFTNMRVRYLDAKWSNRESTIHYPYRSETWTKFVISLFNYFGAMTWSGLGHFQIDALIVNYYALIVAQLKVIKHQAESLVQNENEMYYGSERYHYKDEADEELKKSFVRIVKRYEKIVWFVKQVNITFNFSLGALFFLNLFVICIVIYALSVLDARSDKFYFMLLGFCMFSLQIYMQCYFGNLVVAESGQLTTCLYSCDWISLSPRFRRLLIIAMSRWSQPLVPHVYGLIPVTLETFVVAMKSSFSLFNVLKARQNVRGTVKEM